MRKLEIMFANTSYRLFATIIAIGLFLFARDILSPKLTLLDDKMIYQTNFVADNDIDLSRYTKSVHEPDIMLNYDVFCSLV